MAIVVTQSGETGAVGSTFALGFTPVAGRLLLQVISERNWQVTAGAATGWTRLINVSNTTGYPPCIVVGKEVSDGTEATQGFPGTMANDVGQKTAISLELTGATLVGATLGASGGYKEDDFNTHPGTVSAPVLTPSAANCLVVAACANRSGSATGTATGGWTVIQGQGYFDFPTMTLAYKLVSPASGSYTETFTNGGNAPITMVSFAIYEGASTFKPTQGVIV